MNQKIKELAEQAGSTHKPSLGVYQFYTDELEKFVELIIKDMTRQPLDDDEIRDCAESENLFYFENKEEFDAFARAIEAAHGIK